MNLIVGKNSFVSLSLKRWLKGQYISYKEVNEINPKKYGSLYLLSFNPKYKTKKEKNFNFEKKIFNLFKYKKIIYLSSSKVYPNKLKCNELTSINPQDFYGENKIKIEKIIPEYTKKFFVYRISNAFTKNSFSKGTFFDVLLKNWKNKKEILFDINAKSIKDFITINSLEKSLKLMNSSSKFGIYNIGSQKGLSIKDAAFKFLDIRNNKFTFIENTRLTKNQTLDISKLINMIKIHSLEFHNHTINELHKRHSS